jgi:hypothetical protein
MASRRVNLNGAAIQSLLDGGEGVHEMLMERAQRVLSAAEASAPVLSGEFKSRLGVTEDHTDRLVLRVGSSAPHAHLVEAKHGTMARALDAAGGS